MNFYFNDLFRDLIVFITCILVSTEKELYKIRYDMEKYDLSNSSEELKEIFIDVKSRLIILENTYNEMKKIVDGFEDFPSNSKIVSINRMGIHKFEYEFKKLNDIYQENLRYLELLHNSFITGYLEGVKESMNIIK